jgi:hypothetical protein
MTVDGEITAVFSGEAKFCIYDKNNNPVVTINMETGEVSLRDGVTRAVGAEIFWNHLKFLSTGEQGEIIKLKADIAELDEIIRVRNEEILDLKGIGPFDPSQDNRFEAVADEL